MEISASMVKNLREMTGAGMMDCKKALIETNGDTDKAVDLLREKGLGKAAKKADRLASEGLIGLYVEPDFSRSTVVEINSETDFVAKNDKFQSLVEETTKHIFNENLKDVQELLKSNINGISFEEYLNTQIATIGENLVVRRLANLDAKDGIVNGYIHSNSRIGVLILATCKDENKEKVAELIRKICMHAAAMKPTFISYDKFDMDFVEKETIALKAEIEKENEELKRLGKPLKNVPEFASKLQLNDAVLAKAKADFEAKLKEQNKPEKIWDKIIPGQIERFIADNTLLDQRLTLLSQFFVMDDKFTIEQILNEKSKELNDDIKITEYIRFELGEGLEKKADDFAAEVAAQIG